MVHFVLASYSKDCMGLWELGKVSTASSPEKNVVMWEAKPWRKESPLSGLEFLSDHKCLGKLPFDTHIPILPMGRLSCFSTLSWNHWDENSGFVGKLELRNRSIQAGQIEEEGSSAYMSLWASSSPPGTWPLSCGTRQVVKAFPLCHTP